MAPVPGFPFVHAQVWSGRSLSFARLIERSLERLSQEKKKREREKRDRYQIENEKADVMDPEDMKEIGRGCGGLNNDPGGTVRASSLEPMTLYGKGALQM